ncbi:MAG: hypothetical protein AABY75_03480 [Bacteroidota bacterium]
MRPRLTALFLLAGVVCAHAQHGTSATQTLNLTVKPIAVFAVSGNPQPLIITAADAGGGIQSAEDHTTRFTMTTNSTGQKIVVSINAPMPAGTHLMLQLGHGTGISSGAVDLSSALTPVDAVTGLRPGLSTDQEIMYTFLANASAGPVAPQSRTITYTVTD